MLKLLSEIKQGIFLYRFIKEGPYKVQFEQRCKDSEGVSLMYIKEETILVEGIVSVNALKGK